MMRFRRLRVSILRVSIGVIVLAGVATAAWVLTFAERDGASVALADLQESADGASVADRLEPGMTHRRVIRYFQRYGPIAAEVMESERAGPDTQITETVAQFDDAGCVASITTTRSTEEGELIERVVASPGDEKWGGTGQICLEDFRENRKSLLRDLQETPGAFVAPGDGEIVEVVVPIELEGVTRDPAPGDESGGYRLPYTDDLDVDSVSESYYLRADTLELAGYEMRAQLTDGSAVVLIRQDVLFDDVSTNGGS